MTGYLPFLDGSIGKGAVFAAMMNNKREKEEEGEEKEGVVGVFVERRTMEVKARKKGQR